MKKIYSLLIFAALLAVSCGKSVVESPAVEPEPEQETVYPEIQVALSVDTKTTITDNGDSFSIAFAVDDDIAVFNGEKDEDTHLPCRYRCNRIDGGVAYFSYNPTTDAEREIVPDTELAIIVATYPYRGTTTCGYETYGDGTVKIRMVNAPSSSSSGFAKSALPLIAYADAGEQLTFHHTVGLMQLKLEGSEVNIKKIAVTSDKNIVGDAKVAYAASEPSLEVVGEDGTGGISNFKKATYTFNDASGLPLDSDGVDFYIGLPEGTHNLSLLITDADDNTMLISAPSVPISRGVVIPTTLTYTADPLANLTNLSEFGHFANCYVVSKAGNYCFNARKPDGALVSGDSATWVWASGEAFNSAANQTEARLNAKMMDNISLRGGKIYFNVPSDFTVGNVVLGIVDGSSNLLYTWHIWLTSDDIEDVTAGGITVMDRNLGAGKACNPAGETNADWQLTRGNYYQWGRKDPILGIRNNTAENTSSAYASGNSWYSVLNTDISNVSAWSYNGDFGGVTIEDGAKYPVTMAASKKVPGYIADDKSTLWSERPNANPCPYGYTIISSSQFETLIDAGTPTVSVYNSFGLVNLGGGIMLPRAGMRYGSDGTARSITTDARYYTDNPGTSDGQGYAYRFITSGSTFSSATLTSYDAYNACSVRCVKIGGI